MPWTKPDPRCLYLQGITVYFILFSSGVQQPSSNTVSACRCNWHSDTFRLSWSVWGRSSSLSIKLNSRQISRSFHTTVADRSRVADVCGDYTIATRGPQNANWKDRPAACDGRFCRSRLKALNRWWFNFMSDRGTVQYRQELQDFGRFCDHDVRCNCVRKYTDCIGLCVRNRGCVTVLKVGCKTLLRADRAGFLVCNPLVTYWGTTENKVLKSQKNITN